MELNLLLKYVVFTVLYIEILSFIFNTKIQIQMMLCAIVLTAIASVTIAFDFKHMSRKGIEPNKYVTIARMCNPTSEICKSFVRLLNKQIQDLPETQPIGLFIGFCGILNTIGIIFITVVEYDTELELSKRNEKRVKTIKSLFISNVITVFVIGMLSYLLFTEDLSFVMFGETRNWLNKLKSTEAVLFAMAYLFGSSVYMLHESRMIYKVRVNNLNAK
jgi:hypothetical protein